MNGPSGQDGGAYHFKSMNTALTVLVILAMLATVGLLVAGLVGIVRGSPDPARSNRIMRWRVVLQGAAVLMFVALLMISRHQ